MSFFGGPAPGEAKHEEDVSRDVVHSAVLERDVVPGLLILPHTTSVVTDNDIRGENAAQGESAQFSGVRLPLNNQAARPMEHDDKDYAADEGRAGENEALISASKQIYENKQAQSMQEPLSSKIVAKYLIENNREEVLRWLHAFLQPKQAPMNDASTQTLRESGTQTGEDVTEATTQWRGLEGPSLLPHSSLLNWQDQQGIFHPLIPFPSPEEKFQDQPEAAAATNLDALLMAVDMIEEVPEIDPSDVHGRKRMRRIASASGVPGSLESPMPYTSYMDTGLRPSYPFMTEDVGGSVRSELTKGADPNEMPVIVASLNANAERLQAR